MTTNKEVIISFEAYIRAAGKGCVQDENDIVWKIIDGVWMGKRSVGTFDRRRCWLQDTTIDNIKTWGQNAKNADYSENFYK
jgi:hypothetical protein